MSLPRGILCYILASICACATPAVGQYYFSGIEWQEPPRVELDPLPSDAVVLFDGKDLSAWDHPENWKVEQGVATITKDSVFTKQSFGDCQIHVEWSAPEVVRGKGQGRGNSGVYIMGKYEVQILDSHDNPTYADGSAGAIYKQAPPLVNVTQPPGEWNTYDILFTAPRFKEDGTLKSPAYVSLIHNGVVTLCHQELVGGTRSDRFPKYERHPEKLPLQIQYHFDPVRFRSIWVREIKPLKGKRIESPYLQFTPGGPKTYREDHHRETEDTEKNGK